jgi:hypothetical protein
MNTQTYVKQLNPWGVYARNGHRLLCSDGKIRAAELALTADTYFSVPAKVRVNGVWVSGYCSIESQTWTKSKQGDPWLSVYAFRHHACHSDKLPDWLPDGDEKNAMIEFNQ